jgi:hypothetical protein
LKYQDNPPHTHKLSIYTLKNEGKTGPVQGWVPVVGHKETVEEDEYGRHILYSCMKIEQ